MIPAMAASIVTIRPAGIPPPVTKDFTVTVAQADEKIIKVTYKGTITTFADVFGFDAWTGNPDHSSEEKVVSGTFGSIDSSGQYVDGNSITQTVKECIWFDSANRVFFSLDRAGQPNTGSTFVDIVINGNTKTRASATYYNDTTNGLTYWRWTGVATNPWGGIGNKTLTVNWS